MGPDPRGGGGGAQGEARVWLAAGRCENSIIGSGVGREEASELSGTAGVGGRTGASPEGAPQGRGELAECVSRGITWELDRNTDCRTAPGLLTRVCILTRPQVIPVCADV